ncbi:MAG: hypothetical protein FWF23_04590 [Alphaproteobacteria bacterium]|nr:hypothetical protein [Alphaproteobacteria bacterium]MCL2505344.1 hypothetical protein [Alphaproteobacteria bacterium]
MKKYKLTADETNQLENIKNAYYMPPSLTLCDEFISNNDANLAFNYLYTFLQEAFPKVSIILKKQKKQVLLMTLHKLKNLL